MSNESQVRYFTCPEFKITMPVSECEMRRRAAKAIYKGSQGASDPGVRNSLMTRRCGKCKVFKEALEESISESDMLAKVEAAPSHAGTATARSSGFVQLLTPYAHSFDRRRFPQ